MSSLFSIRLATGFRSRQAVSIFRARRKTTCLLGLERGRPIPPESRSSIGHDGATGARDGLPFVRLTIMAKKQNVFISYSHADETWKDALQTQLGALQADDPDFIDAWDDRRIGVGEKWKEEIEQAMDRASVAVLLISAHFLTSKFILREEVPRLLARAEKELRIVPVIVRACNWQRVSWLSAIQVRPKDGRVINNGTPAQIETDLSVITGEIATILDALAAQPQPNVPPPRLPDPPIAAVEGIAAPPIGGDAQKADIAVREMTKLASTAKSGDLELFRRDLKGASDAIVAITTCKELHDELHTFEAEPFADILNEHTRVDKDARARENLSNRASTLVGTTQLARALASRLPETAAKREVDWIKRLEEAHQLLLGAIASQNVSRAQAGVNLITRVLDMELVRLNETMVNQAAVLDQSVAPVNAALKYVHDNAATLKVDSAREQKVREGIDASLSAHRRVHESDQRTQSLADNRIRTARRRDHLAQRLRATRYPLAQAPREGRAHHSGAARGVGDRLANALDRPRDRARFARSSARP